jgi:ribonuclease HI
MLGEIMTEQQNIVDAIRDGMKGDWILTVWYRSEHGRAIKRIYESADVLKALAMREALRKLKKGDQDWQRIDKELKQAADEPIDSLYREIRVGTTPETDEHTGGYLE